MQIVLEPGRAPSLIETDDFKAFNLRVPGGPCARAALAAMVADAGELVEIDGAPFLWVDRAWLTARAPGTDAWIRGFAAMVEFAARNGWVRADGAIRAHVEWGADGAAEG